MSVEELIMPESGIFVIDFVKILSVLVVLRRSMFHLV